VGLDAHWARGPVLMLKSTTAFLWLLRTSVQNRPHFCHLGLHTPTTACSSHLSAALCPASRHRERSCDELSSHVSLMGRLARSHCPAAASCRLALFPLMLLPARGS
jgi:hypothetical protein